jgi:2-polyprenyl-6-methoxyphenol hydroxylase-like FAD-dependent oxidoreductase
MSNISTTNNTILIAGAGLGGLCLAQALKRNSIPFKIFERDFKQDFRAQGFRLRISEDGILALQYALSPEIWSLFEKTSAEMLGMGKIGRLDALTAEPLPAGGPPGGAHGTIPPFTVDRTTMRGVLLTQLEDDTHFGKYVTRYESNSNGVTVHFADGTSESGGLLVGADGVKSTIRKQLLPDYPFLDSGSRIIYGKTPITRQVDAELSQNLLGGMCLLNEDDSHGVPKTLLLETIRFPQGTVIEHITLPNDYIYWVLLVRREHFSIPDAELLALNNEQSSDLALSLSEKWHPSVKALIIHQDRSQTATLRIHSVDPAIPDWQASERVTLLGDAIHAMPPTGGMGVNTALRDASDLARRIIGARDGQKGLDGLVGEYEQALREFARKPLAASWKAGSKAFGLQPVEQCERISV